VRYVPCCITLFPSSTTSQSTALQRCIVSLQFISDQSFAASSEQDMAPVSLPQSLSHRLDVKAKPKVKCKAPRLARRSTSLLALTAGCVNVA